jgi:hypothetical protein
MQASGQSKDSEEGQQGSDRLTTGASWTATGEACSATIKTTPALRHYDFDCRARTGFQILALH